MSAFLPIRAKRINVCAEYGYSTRTFNKRPWVVVCSDYESSMFLVYRQSAPLPNRVASYRNHFTLFRNDQTVVVVRTETTLVHQDNDAVLLYDVISPSNDERDRYRAVLDRWTVSFDRISYSNQRPSSFAEFDLVCSGEWWFFDRGIILDGVTRYDSENPCDSMLVYYELHPRYVIRAGPAERQRRRADALSFPYPRWKNAINRSVEDKSKLPQAVYPIPQSRCKDSSRSYEEIDASPVIETAVLPNGTAQQNDPFVVDVQAAETDTVTNQTQERLNTDGKPCTETRQAENAPLYASSIPATFLPLVNGVARTVIRSNDERTTPKVRYKAAVPSLYWFRTRQTELLRSDISYFLPVNFTC